MNERLKRTARPGAGSVAASAAGAVLLVLALNAAVFLFFLFPPPAAFAWVLAVGSGHLWWHARPGSSGRPRRVAARIRLRAPRMPPGWIGGAAGATVVAMLGVAAFVEMGTGPLDLTDSPFHARILGYIETLPGWLVFALAAGVVVPMIEEFAFRGRLMRTAERAWGPAAGVLAAAVVFALVHAGGPHPFLLVVPFVMGLFCGGAVLMTGSIWAAVVLHGSWNLTMAILALAAPEEPAALGAHAGENAVVTGLVLIAVGGAWWFHLIRRWPRAGAERGR